MKNELDPNTKKRAYLRFQKIAETRMAETSSRRGFLKKLTAGAAAAVAVTQAGCSTTGMDKFFQDHYKEMSAEEKKKVFARIAEEAKQQYHVDINLKDPPPVPGTRFAFAISLSACNGNRACVHACVKENNQSRDPEIQYIKVIELNRGTFNLEEGTAYYEGEVPKKDKFYLPMQCNQCDNPPCTKVCPVEATWKEDDGIVVIDYDWCIGCRYCMAACPYDARRFNFAEPELDHSQINTNQSYLSNRIRPKGVVEKCHFCLHRTRIGSMPACMEACPTGARKFGNIADQKSDVAQIVQNKRVFVLKEELGTIPNIFYYFD